MAFLETFAVSLYVRVVSIEPILYQLSNDCSVFMCIIACSRQILNEKLVAFSLNKYIATYSKVFAFVSEMYPGSTS